MMNSTPSSPVLKLKREKIAPCMTCPLCQNFFRDATTITECLHTFCRNCICDKIMEDDLDSCPVCNVYLGCAPMGKLRPDHKLQDLRLKFFPIKHDSSAPEAVPPIPLPPRRKKRSLSLIGRPKFPAKPRVTGKRSKPGRRRKPAVKESTFPVEAPVKVVQENPAVKESIFPAEEPVTDVEENAAVKESTFPVNEPVKDVEENPAVKESIFPVEETHLASSKSLENFSEVAQKKIPRFDLNYPLPFFDETYEEQTPDKDIEVEIVSLKIKTDLTKPVNSLVEAACGTKFNKSNSPEIVAIPTVPHTHGYGTRSKPFNSLVESASETKSNELNSRETVAKPTVPVSNGNETHHTPVIVLVDSSSESESNKLNSRETVAKPIVPYARGNRSRRRARVRECGNASKVHGNENDAIPEPSGSVKPRRGRPKRAAASEGLSAAAQAIVDVCSKRDGSFSPIWFSLVASKNQEGPAPLPQIPSPYLRVKDPNLPVSFIEKYIVKKLNLASEAEVEISLWGQPLPSTVQLHTLVNWYAQTTTSSERYQITTGTSARDFVMILSYGRKAPPP